MPTAIGYVRQSRRKDSDASPETQREAIAAYCQSQGWTLEGYHQDIGVSGWDVTAVRPGLDALMSRVSQGGVDVVVVRDLSRLSRRGIREALEIVDTLEASGATLASVGEPFLQTDTPIAQAIFSLFAAFAKQESDLRSEKVKEAKAHVRAVKLEWAGGVAPFGLQVRDRRLQPKPGEAEVVREVVHNIVNGATLRGELQRLNRAGVKPRRADAWGRSSLRTLLRSCYLAGYQPDGKGGYLSDEDGLPLVIHEPVLAPGEWEHLQTVLNARSGQGGGGTGERTFLSGLLWCGVCGGKLHGARGRLPHYGVYRCGFCSGVSVSMAALDHLVARYVVATIAAIDPDSQELDTLARLYGAEMGLGGQPERTELEGALTQLNSALGRVDEAYADGLLELDRYRSQVERIGAKRADVTRQLAALERATPDITVLLDPLAASDDGAEVLMALPTAPAVLKAMVERVVVNTAAPGTWQPERVSIIPASGLSASVPPAS
jgi:site-specific DNA recombinase